jgi:hypothetical protein
MRMINSLRDIHDLRIPPSNRLEKLGGDRTGQYSIRINDQWRICLILNIGVPARRINELVFEKRKITADTLGERLEKEVRIYSKVA